MAPTEGRVARPERRWGCRRGTPGFKVTALCEGKYGISKWFICPTAGN